MVLEKTLESPLDCKELKPVIFIERTNAEAEAPILWPPDARNWLIGKDPEAGKDWRQEEKGMTENKMVGWHHWLNGHEFHQAVGDGKRQGTLACCSPRGHKESDMTEWLNNNPPLLTPVSVSWVVHKQELTHRQKNDWWLPRGEGWEGMEWRFGINRCILLYARWINNKVLLYSTGNYTQYPVINHNGKEYEKKKNIYMYV